MIELKGLSLSVGDKTLLSNLNFEVGHDQSVCLLGPTGCGKSTLLKTIMGLWQPTKGELFFKGELLSSAAGVHVPVEKRPFKFLLQEECLFDHMNVWENIELGAFRYSDKSIVSRKMKELVDMFYLGDLLKREILHLSGGERQRVALARTLLASDAWVLLDEPFSNIDALTKEKVLPQLKAWLKQESLQSFTVTHDKTEAYFLGEEWLVMDQGEVLQKASSEEIYLKPNSMWVAEFSGKVNFMNEKDRALLKWESDQEWCRPEDLKLVREEEGKAEVLAILFEGPVQTLTLKLETGRVWQVQTYSKEAYVVGEKLDLDLRPEVASL